MDNILLVDTSFASFNKGDDIIMECVRAELNTILSNQFELNLPSHISPFHWYQVLRNSLAYRKFANCKLKFVGGSNLLIPNLLTHFPQWNINIFNYQPLKGCILVGVGAGAGAEGRINAYTQYIYKHMLNRHFYHSVRDERSRQYLQRLGIKAINTGCVTMWALTPEHCATIPTQKAEKVIFTLTASTIKDSLDQTLINTLIKNYKEVYFWPQGIDDYEYLHLFNNIKHIKVLSATKQAYKNFLINNATDYVGTRLHGGIYAMRHKRRAIIIAIDERARGIHASNHLNCIEKKDLTNLDAYINSKIITKIDMPFDKIAMWKQQFDAYKI